MSDPDSWHVIVPVKSFTLAKQRLREPISSSREVDTLAAHLARQTLNTLQASNSVRSITVVTDGDPSWAKGFSQVQVITEEQPQGLNNAVILGLSHLAQSLHRTSSHLVSNTSSSALFPSKTMVLHADLPLLSVEHLDDAFTQMRTLQRDAFIADNSGTGTTALLSWDWGHHSVHFGTDSAELHARAGFTEMALAHNHGLRADLDTWDHVDEYRKLHPSRIMRLLEQSSR